MKESPKIAHFGSDKEMEWKKPITLERFMIQAQVLSFTKAFINPYFNNPQSTIEELKKKIIRALFSDPVACM